MYAMDYPRLDITQPVGVLSKLFFKSKQRALESNEVDLQISKWYIQVVLKLWKRKTTLGNLLDVDMVGDLDSKNTTSVCLSTIVGDIDKCKTTST